MDQQNPFTQGRSQEAQKQPRGWPIVLDWLRSPPHVFAATASAALMILGFLFVIFSVVAVLRLGWGLVYGNNQEALEASRVFLPLAAAAVGLPLIIWRLVILNRQTRTAEEKTQIDRETHYTSIFSKSVEQLGATREHKETAGEEKGESRTRTIPNIEVRLGGIHALSRLAEESRRDAPKIENMLLSYVRENSWYSRDGRRHPPQPPLNLGSYPRWTEDYRNEDDKSRFAKDIDKWREGIDAQVADIEIWLMSIPETRVDVTEAVSSLSKIEIPQSSYRLFQECIFVGRILNSITGKNHKFEKCIFVSCILSLENISDADFMRCVFIDCTIHIKGGSADFIRCQLYKNEINISVDSQAFFSWSGLYDLSISSKSTNSGPNTLAIGFVNCVARECSIYSSNVLLSLMHSLFFECAFTNLNLFNGSIIDDVDLIKTSFRSSDLSHLEEYDMEMLSQMVADPGTAHPGGTRPASWPPFDPSYNDIPF